MTDYIPGDHVEILVGGPHAHIGRTATVNNVQYNGDLVVYFGDQDEDEWVYSPGEVRKVNTGPTRDNLIEAIYEMIGKTLYNKAPVNYTVAERAVEMIEAHYGIKVTA